MTDRHDTATVLLSGGLDSGTALALWLSARPGRRALAVFVDYGQRAAAPEAAASEHLARRLGAAWRRIELPWLGAVAGVAGSALVDATVGEVPLPRRDEAERPGDAASAAAVWVPGRNVVLCAAAAAIAESRGDGVVIAGFNREEATTFVDNSPAFLDAMTAVCALGTRNAVRVESPTLALDKHQIVLAAREVGLDRDDFWSCYDAGPTRVCGRCESCVRAQRAWAG